MEGRSDPTSLDAPDDVPPLIKLSLVRRIIEHTLKNRVNGGGGGGGSIGGAAALKPTNDANALSRELVHAFVVEACNRAAAQHDLSGGRGEVTEEHLFHVLPQLLLDF